MSRERIHKRCLPHSDLLSVSGSLRDVLNSVIESSDVPILGFTLFGSSVSGRKRHLPVGDIDITVHVDLNKLYGTVEPYRRAFNKNRISFDDEKAQRDIRELHKITELLKLAFKPLSYSHYLHILRNSIAMHLQDKHSDQLSVGLHFSIALSGEDVLGVAISKLADIYMQGTASKILAEIVKDNFSKLLAMHPIYSLFHISVGRMQDIVRLRKYVFELLRQINCEHTRQFIWNDVVYLLFAIEQGYQYTDGKVKMEPQIFDFTFSHVRAIYRGFKNDPLYNKLAENIDYAERFFIRSGTYR